MVKRLTPGLAAVFGLVLGLLAACDDTTFNQKLQTFCEGDASTGACSCNEGTALNPRCCINDGYACASAADCCGKTCAAAGDGGRVCSGADGGAGADGETGDAGSGDGGADAGSADAGADGGPPGADAGRMCLDTSGTSAGCLADETPCTIDHQCESTQCFDNLCKPRSHAGRSGVNDGCSDRNDCGGSLVCSRILNGTCQAEDCVDDPPDAGFCWIGGVDNTASVVAADGGATSYLCVPPGGVTGGASNLPCCRFSCGDAGTLSDCVCGPRTPGVCACDISGNCAMVPLVDFFYCPL